MSIRKYFRTNIKNVNMYVISLLLYRKIEIELPLTYTDIDT